MQITEFKTITASVIRMLTLHINKAYSRMTPVKPKLLIICKWSESVVGKCGYADLILSRIHED